MDRETEQVKGWRKFKGSFLYGAAAKPEPVPEVSQQCDGTCTQEQVGCGCYRAVVDFEKMDQQ